MDYYFAAWRKGLEFSGRSRRREYWYFVLFQTITLILFMILGGAISALGTSAQNVAFIPYLLFVLASIVPGLAVNVRRLHDIGKSGWWILIGVVPLVGPIILLIFHCEDSQLGDNQYGPNPKALEPGFAQA